MTDDKPSRIARWIGPVVTTGVVVLLISLLLPAVQRTRQGARRTQSKNNLKQIGMALHNYHDVFTTLPPGGIFNAEGTAFHGWTTSIAPYLDCSPFYNSLNFNIPWDHPEQVEKFITTPHNAFLNPSVEQRISPDGIPLVHYAANQWLFHRNSSTSIKDIETGTSNTLAMADAFGHFAPLGYPYIWRDPLLPINTAPDGFGYNKTGMHVLLMDGTVRWINQDMAAEIHPSFAGPETLKPTAEQVAKPAGDYRLKVQPWRTILVFDDPKSSLGLIVRTNSANEPVYASMGHQYDKGPIAFDRPYDDAVLGLDKYPALLKFDGGHYFSDAALHTLAALQQLEDLEIGGKRITNAGAAHIAALSALTTLTLDQTEITAKGLAELARAPKLTALTIIEPKFGDEAIHELEQFPRLTQLELTSYLTPLEISPAALAGLMAARTELSVRVRVQGKSYSAEEIRGLQRGWEE